MLQHPYRALFKHLAIAAVLFLVGLLPWFDNFSSFFGFLFGFLLSYAILPFVSLGKYDRQKKIFMIWVCLITTVFLFLLLVLFFYVIPVYDCEFCGYFNCLPLTRDFCSAQNINFKRTDSPVWHKGARRRASPLNRIPTSILSRFEPRYLLTTPLWVGLQNILILASVTWPNRCKCKMPSKIILAFLLFFKFNVSFSWHYYCNWDKLRNRERKTQALHSYCD